MANINNASDFPDYYETLQCARNASTEELKKSYQSLVLTSHPDKVRSNQDRFVLIQKAWHILRDPESKKVYDAQLSSSDHNKSETLLYDVINLKDMDFSDGAYTYSCRCGSNYVLEETDIKISGQSVVIGCEECSFSLKVKSL